MAPSKHHPTKGHGDVKTTVVCCWTALQRVDVRWRALWELSRGGSGFMYGRTGASRVGDSCCWMSIAVL